MKSASRPSVCDRRLLLAGAFALIAAPALAQTPAPMLVWRDAGCGCCAAWAAQMQRSGRFAVTVQNAPDMGAVKRRLGVPGDLVSCHTGEIGGFVIEGHVPIADVLRLLQTRPAGVLGIAVAGMPVGLPGMEAPDGRRDAYEVTAFHRNGARSVFASNPARG
jgi:hypothetical protein